MIERDVRSRKVKVMNVGSARYGELSSPDDAAGRDGGEIDGCRCLACKRSR